MAGSAVHYGAFSIDFVLLETLLFNQNWFKLHIIENVWSLQNQNFNIFLQISILLLFFVYNKRDQLRESLDCKNLIRTIPGLVRLRFENSTKYPNL